jgi:hypothetical protein
MRRNRAVGETFCPSVAGVRTVTGLVRARRSQGWRALPLFPPLPDAVFLRPTPAYVSAPPDIKQAHRLDESGGNFAAPTRRAFSSYKENLA